MKPFPKTGGFVMLLSLATAMMNSACMVFGVRTVEQPRYQVLVDDGDMEVRLYPSYLVARTKVEGSFEQASNDGFRRLAGYIFGKNEGRRSIAMTAPVTTSSAKSEKIAMTAPVVQEKRDGRWEMEFMMPASYSRETLPQPLDRRISIQEVPRRLVAVVRFNGVNTESDMDERAARLSQWIADQGLDELSRPRSARYDPPFTIPFLRRNEVHITVRQRPEQGAKLSM